MPKISFVTATARNDYPYFERPDLKIFEPTIESLKTQTMDKKDFEWIIVDYLYDKRKDYFKNMSLPFHVKHIPARPNLWHDVSLPGACTQYNKGIIYVDGELIYFTGEGYVFVPEFCERLWKRYKQGYIPLAWYIVDDTFSSHEVSGTCKDWESTYLEIMGKSSEPYNILGYVGKKINIGHRPSHAFKGNNIEVYDAPWEWWFGCSAAPLEAVLKINGFDQRFDGDHTLFDCDFGSRLQLAGFDKFAFLRDLFTIRLRIVCTWDPGLPRKVAPTIKCNYGLIWISRHLGEFRANARKITDKDIKWIKDVFCANDCANREYCRAEHQWQFPFEHKEGYPGHYSEKRLYEFWKNNQVLINLTEERNKRIVGDEKYKEGTYI